MRSIVPEIIYAFFQDLQPRIETLARTGFAQKSLTTLTIELSRQVQLTRIIPFGGLS